MKFSTKQTNNELGKEKQMSSCTGNSMEKTILMLDVYKKLSLKLKCKKYTLKLKFLKIKFRLA